MKCITLRVNREGGGRVILSSLIKCQTGCAERVLFLIQDQKHFFSSIEM